jgi:hypothetical protein
MRENGARVMDLSYPVHKCADPSGGEPERISNERRSIRAEARNRTPETEMETADRSRVLSGGGGNEGEESSMLAVAAQSPAAERERVRQ